MNPSPHQLAELARAALADSGPYCEDCGARWRTEGHKPGCPCLNGYPCKAMTTPIPDAPPENAR